MANRDDELDDLDDYLDEFQDEILNAPYEAPADKKEEKTQETKASEASTAKDAELTEEQMLESLLKGLGQESPEAKAQFESLLKDLTNVNPSAAASSSSSSSQQPSQANLKDTINSTLNRLKESGTKVDQSIKDEQVPGQDMLADLLANLNMDGDGDDGDISKLLGDMLSALASKEVLYGPLKDLDTKYPQWLKDNEGKLSADDLKKYTEQAAIIRALVERFERPDYKEDNEEDRAFVSQKLEEMQASGDPPKEIVGDEALPGFGFGSEDLPDGLDLEKDLDQNCQQQ